MARKFQKGDELFRAMRHDLLNKTFPHFLTHLATASKVQLQAGLSSAAAKANGKPPPIKMSVSKVPPPGASEVGTTYLSSAAPEGDQKSPEEAAAYKDVFRRFYKDKLGSKALVLRLLASVGVS